MEIGSAVHVVLWGIWNLQTADCRPFFTKYRIPIPLPIGNSKQANLSVIQATWLIFRLTKALFRPKRSLRIAVCSLQMSDTTLAFIAQVTEQTTVKWSIIFVLILFQTFTALTIKLLIRCWSATILICSFKCKIKVYAKSYFREF